MRNSGSFSVNDIIRQIQRKKSKFWLVERERMILDLFHSTSQRVPAYKDFLKRNKVNPAKVKNLKDFALVPPTDKVNYLHAYPIEKLFWEGNIKKPLTFHATSGSTGEPTYFQRDRESDLVREVIIGKFFKNDELTVKGPTLFVVTFGMGVWSAGMGIYSAAYLAGNDIKLPVSVITPGLNKAEISKILKKLAPRFKQVIIAGYPPFVKDLIDNAVHEGINIRKLNLRLIFTGEAFPEEFRDYLIEKKAVRNIYTDTMNTYGTSELGAIAVETPLSILGMRLAHKDRTIFNNLFGASVKTPTLAQYIPTFVNFECVNGELFFTGNSPAPLVKYQSGDHGGIFTYNEFAEVLGESSISIQKKSEELKISKYTSELPFVYVYERKNLATTLYGILIYPEFIKTALLDKRLNYFLTGKFTMITKYDGRNNQYLEINLELKKGLDWKKIYAKDSLRIVTDVLRKKSSEFRELSDHLRGRRLLKFVFWPYEHPKYFTLSNKHKWVKKN